MWMTDLGAKLPTDIQPDTYDTHAWAGDWWPGPCRDGLWMAWTHAQPPLQETKPRRQAMWPPTQFVRLAAHTEDGIVAVAYPKSRGWPSNQPWAPLNQ